MKDKQRKESKNHEDAVSSFFSHFIQSTKHTCQETDTGQNTSNISDLFGDEN